MNERRMVITMKRGDMVTAGDVTIHCKSNSCGIVVEAEDSIPIQYHAGENSNAKKHRTPGPGPLADRMGATAKTE